MEMAASRSEMPTVIQGRRHDRRTSRRKRRPVRETAGMNDLDRGTGD